MNTRYLPSDAQREEGANVSTSPGYGDSKFGRQSDTKEQKSGEKTEKVVLKRVQRLSNPKLQRWMNKKTRKLVMVLEN